MSGSIPGYPLTTAEDLVEMTDIQAYPKLYKTTSAGDVQVWWMEREGNKTRACSGKKDGKIVRSEWTTHEGKNIGRSNATDPVMQARSEADSDYKKKRKKGYVDSEDGADTSDKIRPMLAKGWDDHGAKVNFLHPVYSQPKFDGFRCIAKASGLQSRPGDAIASVPHIVRELRPVFAHAPDLVIDGELYNHDFCSDFNKLSSLISTKKPTEGDWVETEQLVQYHVYDFPNIPGPFPMRWLMGTTLLVQTVGIDVGDGPIRCAQTDHVKNRDHLDELYEQYVTFGYEGQMVRWGGERYKFGGRSQHLLKRKGEMDQEFSVKRIYEGKGNRSGMAGYASFDAPNGEEFTAAIMGGIGFCKHVLANKTDYEGKPATVIFQNWTPTGKPRFPRVKTIWIEGKM